MSVLLTNENGWIISHSEFINNLYSNVDYCNSKCTLKFDKNVFNINSPYIRANQILKTTTGMSQIYDSKKSRKRKRIQSFSLSNDQQVQFVQQALQKIIATAVLKGFYANPIVIDYNEQARIASEHFYNYITHDTPEKFNGGNQSDIVIITKIGSSEYAIPGNCIFYSYDIREIHERLELNNQFDFILMDPPWWNKFIRRNKSYSYKMMYNDELRKIPINKLLNINGIIAIWCTNASTHLNNILDVMFPTWGMKLIAKWYWVKVTQSGNVVCDFDYGSGKQPYELLIFGALSTNQTPMIPDKKILVSVPSAIHSHKPPIAEVMRPYLVQKPNCLEIFARYLLPGWTSWGLEVLKFQRLSLYNVGKMSKELQETDIS